MSIMICRTCEGTGWLEGGTAIRTPCHSCGGAGTKDDLVHQPLAPRSETGRQERRIRLDDAGYCALCGLAHEGPHTAPVSRAEEGLDFETAEREGWKDVPASAQVSTEFRRWDESAFRISLNAQHRALLAAAVAEAVRGEREKVALRIKEFEGIAGAYTALHDRLNAKNWSSHSVMLEVESVMRGDE